MPDEPKRPADQPAFGPALQEALTELEQGLRSAFHAIEQIRDVLTAGLAAPPAAEAPVLRLIPKPSEAAPAREEAAESTTEEPPPSKDADPYTPFERLWERMEHERIERQSQGTAEPERHGLDLLPQMYLVTVEDREHRVDLVPLHRALQGIEGVEEITLVSFANGVPVVSLRAKHQLDLEQLSGAVGSTLRRACELIPQDNGRVFLRLTPLEKIGV